MTKQFQIDTKSIIDLNRLSNGTDQPQAPTPTASPCCISLSSAWCTIVINLIQTYLIITMTKRVLVLTNSITQSLLITYLILLMILIALLFIYTLTSTRKIGNYANDGYKFGQSYLTEHRSKTPSNTILQTIHQIWRHFMPINALTHYTIATILLYANLYLIYNPYEKFSSLKNASNFSDNEKVNAKILNEIFAENLLPELGNYVLATFILVIKYAQVFWIVNKFLSFVISFVGALNLLQQLFQIFTLNYLALLLHSHSEASIQGLIIRTNYLLIYLHFVLKFFIIVSIVPLYIFVYLKYKERFFYEKSVLLALVDSGEKIEQPDASSSPISSNSSAVLAKKPANLKPAHLRFYFNYCPHLCAVIILCIIFMFKVLFCYDMITLLNEFRNHVIMFAIIYEIMHLIVLIFVWFLLTLKLKWAINYEFAFKLTQFYVLVSEMRANGDLKQVTSDKELLEKGVDVVDVNKDVVMANNDENAPPKYIARSTTQESQMNDSEAVYRNEIRKSINNLFFSSYNNYYNLKPTIRLKKSLSKSYYLNRNSAAAVDERVLTGGGYLNPQVAAAKIGQVCNKSSSSSLVSNHSPPVIQYGQNCDTPQQRTVRSVPTTVSWATRVPRRPVMFLNEDMPRDSLTPVASTFYTEYESRV